MKINPTGSSITLDKGSGNPGGGAPDGGMLDLNFIETFIAEYEINGRLNAPSSSAFNRDFGRILRNGSEYSTSEVDALAAIRNDSHCADEVIFGATYTIQNYNSSKFGRELKLGDGTDCKAFLTSLENEYELKYRAPDIGFVSVQEPVGYGDSPEILLVGPNVYRPEQKTDGEKGTYTAVEVKCAKRSSDHIFQANYTCSRLFGIEAFIGSTTNPDINLSFGQFVQRPTVKNNITFGIGADYKIASPFSGGHIYAGVEYRRTTGDYNSFINVGPGTVGVAGGSYKNQSYGVNVRLEGDIGERFILGGGFGLFLSDHDLNGAFRANGTNIEAAIEALLHYRLANNISIGPSAHIFIPLDRSLSGGAGATSANPVRFSTTPREIRFGVRFRF